MNYEHGQEVECRVLYPASKAANRWQLLASELEQIVLTRLRAPQALPTSWTSEDSAKALAKDNIPAMPVLRLSDTHQGEAQIGKFCTEAQRALDPASNPYPHVSFSSYSERRAYFWQEAYNIIGYLWSLEEEDAA